MGLREFSAQKFLYQNVACAPQTLSHSFLLLSFCVASAYYLGMDFIMENLSVGNSFFRALAGLCLPAVIFLVIFFNRRDPTRGLYPTLNDKRPFEFSDARVKRNFIVTGRQLLREGLNKFNGKPFRIITDHGPTVILPPSYIQELRNLDNLSHVRAIAEVWVFFTLHAVCRLMISRLSMPRLQVLRHSMSLPTAVILSRTLSKRRSHQH